MVSDELECVRICSTAKMQINIARKLNAATCALAIAASTISVGSGGTLALVCIAIASLGGILSVVAFVLKSAADKNFSAALLFSAMESECKSLGGKVAQLIETVDDSDRQDYANLHFLLENFRGKTAEDFFATPGAPKALMELVNGGVDCACAFYGKLPLEMRSLLGPATANVAAATVNNAAATGPGATAQTSQCTILNGTSTCWRISVAENMRKAAFWMSILSLAIGVASLGSLSFICVCIDIASGSMALTSIIIAFSHEMSALNENFLASVSFDCKALSAEILQSIAKNDFIPQMELHAMLCHCESKNAADFFAKPQAVAAFRRLLTDGNRHAAAIWDAMPLDVRNRIAAMDGGELSQQLRAQSAPAVSQLPLLKRFSFGTYKTAEKTVGFLHANSILIAAVLSTPISRPCSLCGSIFAILGCFMELTALLLEKFSANAAARTQIFAQKKLECGALAAELRYGKLRAGEAAVAELYSLLRNCELVTAQELAMAPNAIELLRKLANDGNESAKKIVEHIDSAK
ncbi:MAG: hypothetical protein LBI39_02745 [Puniceicoccales bacterium]|nr:hypothetical protein [Puniceicoccales bacterium]